jgi:hypothetical protein
VNGEPSFDRLDTSRLSPQSRWALEHLAYPQRVEDRELAELAEEYELSLRVAKRMLAVLDAEIRAQQFGAELPELSRNEFVALELQLIRWGQIYPVVRAIVGEHRTMIVVDGGNREALLEKLELPVSYIDVDVRDMEEARALGLALNLARRHLDSRQVRDVIAAEILHDPRRSDRAIAELVGSTHPTVAKVRRYLEKLGRVESLSIRIRTDGREHVVAPAAPRREEKLTEILSELNSLGRAEDRAAAHARADALVAEALKLLGARAIAELFERVVQRGGR